MSITQAPCYPTHPKAPPSQAEIKQAVADAYQTPANASKCRGEIRDIVFQKFGWTASPKFIFEYLLSIFGYRTVEEDSVFKAMREYKIDTLQKLFNAYDRSGKNISDHSVITDLHAQFPQYTNKEIFLLISHRDKCKEILKKQKITYSTDEETKGERSNKKTTAENNQIWKSIKKEIHSKENETLVNMAISLFEQTSLVDVDRSILAKKIHQVCHHYNTLDKAFETSLQKILLVIHDQPENLLDRSLLIQERNELVALGKSCDLSESSLTNYFINEEMKKLKQGMDDVTELQTLMEKNQEAENQGYSSYFEQLQKSLELTITMKSKSQNEIQLAEGAIQVAQRNDSALKENLYQPTDQQSKTLDQIINRNNKTIEDNTLIIKQNKNNIIEYESLIQKNTDELEKIKQLQKKFSLKGSSNEDLNNKIGALQAPNQIALQIQKLDTLQTLKNKNDLCIAKDLSYYAYLSGEIEKSTLLQTSYETLVNQLKHTICSSSHFKAALKECMKRIVNQEMQPLRIKLTALQTQENDQKKALADKEAELQSLQSLPSFNSIRINKFKDIVIEEIASIRVKITNIRNTIDELNQRILKTREEF